MVGEYFRNTRMVPRLLVPLYRGLEVGDEALFLQDADDFHLHLRHRDVDAVLLSDVGVADASQQVGDGVHDYLTRRIS